MKSFSFISIPIIALSALAKAHGSEDHGLPTAISRSILSNSISATATAIIFYGPESTVTSLLQSNPSNPGYPVGPETSSIVPVMSSLSILTDTAASPAPESSSMTISTVSPTVTDLTTVALVSPTTVSTTSTSLVSPTSVSSTMVSVTTSSASTTDTAMSTSTSVAGAAATDIGVGLGGFLGVAAGVLAIL